MTVTADQMNRLTMQLARAIQDLEQLKKTDAELKESVCGYYAMIVRWIEVALAKEDVIASNLCLATIKESLLGTIKEWRGQ